MEFADRMLDPAAVSLTPLTSTAVGVVVEDDITEIMQRRIECNQH